MNRAASRGFSVEDDGDQINPEFGQEALRVGCRLGRWAVLNFCGSIGTENYRGCDMRKSGRKEIPTASRGRVRSDHALVGTWEDPEEKFRILVRYNHPLVGTWQEVENPISETSVVYKIAVVHGHFVVSGVDEADGTRLTISDIRWDGAALYFTSVYPRTGRRVKHLFREFKRGLVNHDVTSTDHEVWRKRTPEKAASRSLKSKIAHRLGRSTQARRSLLP
jgi:hypothetical protein